MKIHLFAVAILLGSAMFTCQQTQPANVQTAADTPSALLINLTSDATIDPHSSLMGLHLGQNALKNNLNVTVFLNVHGVKLMGPQADTITFRNENLHSVLQDIITSGGKIVACPHCMEAHDIQRSDLLEGVTVAQDTTMMAQIKRNPAVFTY